MRHATYNIRSTIRDTRHMIFNVWYATCNLGCATCACDMWNMWHYIYIYIVLVFILLLFIKSLVIWISHLSVSQTLVFWQFHNWKLIVYINYKISSIRAALFTAPILYNKGSGSCCIMYDSSHCGSWSCQWFSIGRQAILNICLLTWVICTWGDCTHICTHDHMFSHASLHLLA